ncbi:MAG: ribosomal protein S18-alanine N-acetyltransferase [Candidatus Nanopelagicales bacterium]
MSGAGASPAQGVRIRRLRWWDIEEVHELERQLFPTDPWTVTQFWAELARVPESRCYFVARRGERIVGYAGIFLTGPTADVQTVAVAGDVQGGGIGRLLMAELIDAARERGARVLQLEVRAENASAMGLYERLGFVADGRRRDYYGRGADAVLMSLDLVATRAGREGGVRA